MLHIQITRDFVHLEAGLYGMKNTIAYYTCFNIYILTLS
jgi:hypothetical protein